MKNGAPPSGATRSAPTSSRIAPSAERRCGRSRPQPAMARSCVAPMLVQRAVEEPRQADARGDEREFHPAARLASADSMAQVDGFDHRAATLAHRQRWRRLQRERSRTAAKKPSQPWRCGKSCSVGPVSSAMLARARSAPRCPARTPGWAARNCVDDRLVFIRQDTARRVDQPAARLHERRGGGEDRRLLGRQLRNGRFRLAPFEIGIAAQRAEAGARRVHQHAVDLAGEPLHLGVALALQQLRMNVRQAGALQARRKVRETLRATSNAYSRPCERISAPSSSVLPPAPAQKSTTMSERLGATA